MSQEESEVNCLRDWKVLYLFDMERILGYLLAKKNSSSK